MKISQATLDTIFDLNEFAQNKLKNVSDVTLLLQASNKNETTSKLFKDLVFSAKYLNGLGKIMMNSVTGNIQSKNIEKDKEIIESSSGKIRTEYMKNIEHFINQLNFIITEFDENEKSAFTGKYLNYTRTSMINLTSLIYDLSWVKKYYNEKGL